MKTHPVLGVTAVLCLWLPSLEARALDVVSTRHALAIPVNVAGRPAGSVTCGVSVGPTVPVTALAFSPDGKTLAAGGYREVLLWDLARAKLAKRIAAGAQVGAVAFLKDGKTLAVGEGTPGVSGAVYLLDLSSGEEIVRSELPKDVVTSLALSPDGKLLAASGAYPSAHVWNVDEKKLVATLGGHSDWILHVAFSRDGKLLSTAAADNTAQVWNVKDWKPVAKLTEAQPVRGAALHADGVQVLLASGGPEGSQLRFRKTDNPAYRRPIGLGPAIPLGMLGPSKANRVYIPCSDKTVKVYDITNGRQLATLAGHQDWVDAVALSADETKIASGSEDGTVKLWSNQDGRLLATLVQLAPQTDQWLALAPQGQFATSSPRGLTWKTDKGPALADKLIAGLQSPESVVKAIADEKPKPKPQAKPAPKTKTQPPAAKKISN